MSASNPPRYRLPLTRTRTPAIGQSKSARYSACPYLGTEADPGTSLSFPSDANHCYRTRLPVPISGIHQESYCISDQYQVCPVYQQNLHLDDVAVASAPLIFYDDPLQMEAAVVAPPQEERSSNLRSLVVAALMLALLLGSWWIWRGFLSEPDPNLALNTLQQQQTESIAGRPPLSEGGSSDLGVAGDPGSGMAAVVESELQATPTPPPATPEPVATQTQNENGGGIVLPELPATATPAATAEAEDELCERTPVWWMPYVVQSGDTLDRLAEQLGIDRDLIMASNCLDQMVIVPGLTISLPPLGIVVEITPAAEATATGRPAPTATGGGSVAIAPSPTIIPTVVPTTAPPTVTAGPQATDEPGDPAPPSPAPTRRPTIVPTVTLVPTATPPTLTPPTRGPTATPPVLPTLGTPTATPPGLPGSGPPTATPPALP